MDALHVLGEVAFLPVVVVGGVGELVVEEEVGAVEGLIEVSGGPGF